MKKLLFISALLCVLCSCGSGNGGAKKYNEDVVKADRTEYKEYVKLALEQDMYGDKEKAVKYYEAALELEKVYSGTEYSHWFNSDVAGKLDAIQNPSCTGIYNGHEWVDLGLPSGLKWATCNVGALTPEEYGNYYAWGEISPKSEYTWENSISLDKSWSDISGNSGRDAARANWGGSWRMPTNSELQELRDKCTWTRSTQHGHKGYKVTGPNGQSIFLPAAGCSYDGKLDYAGEDGSYWSSSPEEVDASYAYYLYFSERHKFVHWNVRYLGHSVRPVLND